MFLKGKRAQSTAEYAIVLGLVIAIAAGVTQVLLKGAMKDKQKQAIGYLMDAGKDELPTGQNAPLYTEDFRETTVDKDNFIDENVLSKGGKEEKKQQQTTETTAVSVETINATTP